VYPMKEQSPFWNLKNILGYGAELADALQRYSSAAADADAGEGLRSDLLRHWASWMEHCPHAEHLCCLDITFFSPDRIREAEALSIVITPRSGEDGNQCYNDYMHALRVKYLAGGHTMALHRIFAAGLPRLLGPNGAVQQAPQTSGELDAFFDSLQVGDHVESGLLVTELGTSIAPLKGCNNVKVNLTSHEVRTYGHDSDSHDLAEVVAESSILEQWEAWRKVFIAERDLGHLRSSSNAVPHWALVLPVGNRNDSNPRDFNLVAGAFLFFDDQTSEEQMKEAVRYVLLYLYEANANAWAVRRGEVEGKSAALISAMHELKNTVAAIVPNASAEVLNILRSYFSEVLGLNDARETKIDLEATLRMDLEKAAKIEKVCLLAGSGDIGNEEPAVVDAQLQAHAELVSRALELPTDFGGIIEDDADALGWFRLAMVGALRNAIKHSFRSRYRSQRLYVSIEKTSTCDLLIIKNQFDPPALARMASSFRKPKESGTLGALKAYARLYGMDPRLVRVQRITEGVESETELSPEMWRTSIPIPKHSGRTTTNAGLLYRQ
jgi:hypothetical protein